MPATKKKTINENIAVSVDPELKARIVEQAAREERPVGQFTRILIKEALAQREAAAAQKE